MIMSSAYRNVRETVTDDPLNEGSTAARIRTLGFINEKILISRLPRRGVPNLVKVLALSTSNLLSPAL